jgi:hypothetical protein
LVGIPSRRAASDALRNSTAISTSRRSIEPKLTVQSRDLVFELRQDCEMITVGEHVSGVLERSQQFERLFEVVAHLTRRLGWRTQSALALGYDS